MMADCEGRLTGKPGICFVTRGPGATNASAGVHIAQQDSNPMIIFIGQIARGIKEREAFQEVDYKAFYGSMAKWVVEIDDAARVPELVTRAFAVATSGRPGPVVISLPEDMLTDEVEAPEAPALHAGRNPSRRAGDGPPASNCSKGGAPVRGPWRHALDRRGRKAGVRRHQPVEAAGRLLLPPPDAVRPAA
jgi:thiamine pyrophosphate-dependent acetolactate synthase large subunit-like protein